MTTKNFVVKNGLATGNIILDASSSNITANFVVANLSVPASANLGSNANVTITGGTTGQYLQTDGSGALSWVTIAPSSSYGDSNVAAYLPTYTGNIAGNIVTLTGNVTASYFIGNGSQLTGLPATYANSNVASYLPTYTGNITGNIVTLTGNITAINANLGNLVTANYFIGAGNLLSNIQGSNVSGQVANALVATTAGTVTAAAQPNITSVGALVDLTVSGNLTVSGVTEYTNVTNLYVKDPIIEQGGLANAGTLTSNDGKDRGQLLHYYSGSAIDAFMGWDNSNAEFAFGSNVSVSSEVVTFNAFGNVRANYFIGNSSQLTGVIANANYSLYSGTVTASAQPNITSVGTLSSIGVTANVTAGNILTDHLLYANGSAWTMSGTPGGSNTYIQFNDSGSFGGNASLVFDKATTTLTANNLVATSTANLGSIANVTITGGASGQVLTTNGTGVLSWQTVSSGGSATNAAFAFNSFSGNGVQDTFELSSTPDSINNIVINYNGAMQLQEAYTLSGANVTFDEPPADGSKVEVLVLNGGGGGGGSVDASALLSPFLLMGA